MTTPNIVHAPMSPKLSIVIPVYNVEPYLERCLDSVLNQTLKKIQVICVNDGSTDGSQAILDDYAMRDGRIMTINQSNSGGGAARNAALPHIKGKYTFYMDADDWLDLTLCEKACQKAEQTGADIVFWGFAKTRADTHTPKFDEAMPSIRVRPEERIDLLLYFTSTCLKLWRSDFLREKQILFSEGRRPYNDVLQHWKGVVLADKIAILNEELYYRSIRQGSYQQTLDKSHFSIIDIIDDTKNMLIETNKSPEYENVFVQHKLLSFRRTYLKLPMKYRRELRNLIRQSLTDKDEEFISGPLQEYLSVKARQFYSVLCRQEYTSNLKLILLEIKAMAGKQLRGRILSPLKHGLKWFFD